MRLGDAVNKIKVLEDFYLSDEILLYLLLFIIMSVGMIWANRYFTGALEGGFYYVLRYASLSSYIFITNVALFYLFTTLIFGMGVTNSYVVVVGYYITSFILYALLFYIVMYLLVIFFYFRMVFGIFRR